MSREHACDNTHDRPSHTVTSRNKVRPIDRFAQTHSDAQVPVHEAFDTTVPDPVGLVLLREVNTRCSTMRRKGWQTLDRDSSHRFTEGTVPVPGAERNRRCPEQHRCRHQGPNWGPSDLQSDALPTELSRTTPPEGRHRKKGEQERGAEWPS